MNKYPLNKETYELSELEIIKFRTADVIITSDNPNSEDDETELIK